MYATIRLQPAVEFLPALGAIFVEEAAFPLIEVKSAPVVITTMSLLFSISRFASS